MATTILFNVSRTGATKQNHIIIDENVNIKSLAALVLLNEDLKYQDEDYIEKTSELQNYLNKRYYYLSTILCNNGDLVCKYCGKHHLEVGHRLLRYSILDSKNDKLATIDHIVPKSAHLIDPMDENNWCVSCKNCNKEKGSKSVEEFIKSRL